MAQLWEDDRLKKEERERVDRETAAKRNEEMKAILDLQVQLFKQYKEAGEQHKRAEEQELLAEWERLKRVEEELREHHRQSEIAVRILSVDHKPCALRTNIGTPS
jgi:hypothetical protein